MDIWEKMQTDSIHHIEIVSKQGRRWALIPPEDKEIPVSRIKEDFEGMKNTLWSKDNTLLTEGEI